MKKIALLIIAALSMVSSGMSAQEFFDTSEAAKFFNIGARIGFNTSNRTFPIGRYTNTINTSWGIGFNAGVVANMNFREYLSVQPGLFFESRSGNLFNFYEDYRFHFERDHQRAYYFTIPVMGIVKFNLSDRIKWNVEFGPYLQFKLKEDGGQKDVTLNTISNEKITAKNNSFDVGFKMGTGLNIYEHYYIGVHYLAGMCNAWSTPSGGRNKSWMFSIGYDF